MPEPARVLLVSDDPAVRQLLGAVLTREGMNVRRSRDAEDALRVVATESHQFVVVDLVNRGFDASLLISLVRSEATARLILINPATESESESGSHDVAYVTIEGVMEPHHLARVVELIRGFERAALEQHLAPYFTPSSG